MSQLYYGDTPLAQMPASYPASRVTHESVSVTADGVKTYGQIFDELHALVDLSKITPYSILQVRKEVFQFMHIDNGALWFTQCYFDTSTGKTKNTIAKVLTSSSEYYAQTQDGAATNYSGTAVPNNGIITLYY